MDSQERKRDHETSISSKESQLTTDVEIMDNAKKIMKTVTHNLDPAVMMHSGIIFKINEMDRVRRKKETMGIFGKSGDGKSSLLNAVLGKKDLLPSDSYGACTAIATRVEANLDDANYIAEIELFSKEEWEKELRDLFRVLSDESEDRNDDMLETAVEKITALYGDDADKKTLEKLLKDDKFTEIENLSFNKKIISNSDVSEFTNEVANYIQHSEASPGGWYWPLVKSVTVKIPDCHELLEHIVLVDIPGTGDCNKVRDDLGKSSLRECSIVWIVSPISRAIKDKEPWGILKHCIEELGPGGKCRRINFICTKTDEINEDGYMRSARLPEQLKRNKDQKKICILHRNEHAKTDVKERLEKSDIKKIFSTDNYFQVFTVSSTAFFDPKLNFEPSETDIPKLQDDLMILNKNIKRELTRDYVNEAKGVLSLIKSVQQDTEKKTNETRDSIHEELKNNLKKALNELDNSFANIYRVLEQLLSNGVEKSKQSCVATTKDVIVLKRDGRRFHKIFQSLCKNGGYYLSKNREVTIDLNKALAKNLHECIQEDFMMIFPVNGKTGKSLQEEIDKFSICHSVSAHSRSSMFRHIQKYIKTEETKLKERLKREIIGEKTGIYSSIQETIKNEMASCYEQAAAVTGTGSMKKRQEMIITTVDEIKHDMFNKAKMEMLKRLNNLKLYIKDDLESGLNKSMELSQSQTSNIKFMDVSRETEQLERLSGLLERL